MNIFAPFWEKDKPDFINDDGHKWWSDKSSNGYANILGLENVSCWVVELSGGELSRVVIQNNQVVKECNTTEEIGIYLDFMRLAG